MSFLGEFRHTIDAKGRLIVPSKLRDELEDDSVVLLGWAEDCIALYSGTGWKEFQDNIIAQKKNDRDSRRAVRKIGSSAHEDTVDRQGRIGVPQHLRDMAGIERDVVVVGAFDHAEIWSPEKWEQETSAEGARMDELVEKLDL